MIAAATAAVMRGLAAAAGPGARPTIPAMAMAMALALTQARAAIPTRRRSARCEPYLPLDLLI